MAALVYAKKAKQPVTAEQFLRTTFKIYEGQPPRLDQRVHAQTNPGAFTLVLAAVAVVLYLALKFLQWTKYDVLYFGWFDATLAALAALAALFFIVHALHRSVPARGTMHPVTLFFREDKQMVQLTLNQGAHRAKTALAGPVPAGYGVTVGRLVFVDYTVDATRYLGQGSLFPGDTPAMVRIDNVPTFAVVCDRRKPTRAVLVTEYDYEAALGEAS